MTKREKDFPTEADLCSAFADWAREEGFTVYPETAGWDLLLVTPDGLQLGVEGKLAMNLKVLAQSLRGISLYGCDRGPDFRGVVVPASHEGTEEVFATMGIEVFTPYSSWRREGYKWAFQRRANYLTEMFDWNPVQRCELPDFVPDVPAGVPAPRTLSPWKVGALRVQALLELQGFVTREEVRKCKNDPRRWCATDGWLTQLGNGRWGKGSAPDFGLQHPEIYAQILAEQREKLAPGSIG
ncbi:hypothetical protein [Dyella japonica]|uniref:Uncharacterized protein n=1 Tax=Dyella japonica DSM 16301 TaxID=1440762 RepID=A0A0G9HCK9_9GAMM|nr:hypothetical protein [Dyella japonica]KLD65442.1 hypothetical protein Y882_02680 [Dyella japonica DSM 16301]